MFTKYYKFHIRFKASKIVNSSVQRYNYIREPEIE